ncbi:MAG: CRISPR-associated helicase Cas3' [Propioniciclava sp.]
MHSWTNDVLAIWGKTDPKHSTWLPLVHHLSDAADMADILWSEWLADSIVARLSYLFGGKDTAHGIVILLAGVHDLGKCAPAFQGKADRIPGYGFLAQDLRNRGFDVPPLGPRPTPHGLLGQMAVADLLRQDGVTKLAANGFSQIIGAHHGTPADRSAAGRVPPRDLGSGLWHATRTEIWQAAVKRSGLEQLGEVLSEEIPPWAQVQLNAVVVMADWMSSNIDLFPHTRSPDRLHAALEALDLPERWRPSVPHDPPENLLHGRFPHLAGLTPQPLQQAAVEAAQALNQSALLIFEAPMGSGKTEAALLASEIIAASQGVGGTFVALPTMATANPMFSRVAAWLRRVAGSSRTALSLAHSKAALQPEFRELSRGRFVSITDDEPPGQLREGGTEPSTEVYVAGWFRGRRRAALATHVVGTIDQALFGSLRAKHAMLRQLALVSKVVVLDEVHAADDFMSVFLTDVLAWLGHHQVPVLLLSATLPPAQRKELATAYASGWVGRPTGLELPASGGYPRLTVVTSQADDWPVTQPNEPASQVVLSALDDGLDTLLSLLRAKLTDGGCAGVICSTVARAQERYAYLKSADIGEVMLIHSKFVAPHRADRESELVARLGPRGDRPNRIIVVGTQVLEQSLDIDFDVLVSDVAPMDLLMQRVGRLHRHPGRARPDPVSTAQCFLVGLAHNTTPPEIDRGVAVVYGTWPVWSCVATLGPLPVTLALPHDIPSLVATAYDEDRAAPTEWGSAWTDALQRHQDTRSDRRRKARAFALPLPEETLDLADWANNLASDPEASAQSARARVRDTDESLEVVLIQVDEHDNPRVLDDVGPYSGAMIPRPLGERDAALARTVATCTVALPRSLTHPGAIDATITALEKGPLDLSSWQASAWLQGQLVVVLNPDGRATVGDATLAYDRELGLREVRVT